MHYRRNVTSLYHRKLFNNFSGEPVVTISTGLVKTDSLVIMTFYIYDILVLLVVFFRSLVNLRSCQGVLVVYLRFGRFYIKLGL